jgi:hypothetical protein
VAVAVSHFFGDEILPVQRLVMLAVGLRQPRAALGLGHLLLRVEAASSQTKAAMRAIAPAIRSRVRLVGFKALSFMTG